jgi:tagaturonate reductase
LTGPGHDACHRSLHPRPDQTPTQPETVLQFGGGNFLRAFADLFLHEANEAGQHAGRAVVVTSTNSDRTRWINDQKGCYHVVVRGLTHGNDVDQVIRVDQGISRALSATDQWDAVLEVAESPDLRWIISNTTEAGLQLADDEVGADTAAETPSALSPSTPISFPAKLLTVLAHRHHCGLPGVTILPCELVDANADVLRGLVFEQAQRWRLPDVLMAWLDSECRWVNTLVDRIVSGRPASHPLLHVDALLTVTEPFALWAIQDDGRLGFLEHDAIERVPDITPYSLRKVRILNGAHTALVARALPMGIETVGAAIGHDDVDKWLHQLLEEEILPALGDRVEGADDFAAATFERFANPWLEHRLADIALHHETKLQTRLQPSFDDYVNRFGEKPPLLAQILGR